MKFEFFAPTRIIFGAGAMSSSLLEISKMGSRALLVTGSRPERFESIIKTLSDCGMSVHVFSLGKEPDIQTVCEARALAKRTACELVISVGGGSAIDTGKAVSALVTNDGEITDYLEVVGKGLPITNRPVPFVAVPTTAGTGAEVTRNAVIGVPERRVKVSMRSPLMIPSLAVIDPLLGLSVSPQVTAAVGLDALTQLIEPYVSNQANFITDTLCKEGISRAAESLASAVKNTNDLHARENMCIAALFGGLALANAKLGAVHGLAGPIGGMFDAPHGEICGILLPYVMEAVIKAAKERAPSNVIIDRYDDIARILTKNSKASAIDGANWVSTLTQDFSLPKLSAFGIADKNIDVIVDQAVCSSSMKGSPIELTKLELKNILIQACS